MSVIEALPQGVSVVIPVYRSKDTLRLLVERLEAALAPLNRSFEVILVDDGSPDGSWEEIQRITENLAFVRGIRMWRNFGQHAAVLCGVRAARYDAVVTMDDDLQHPPEEIGRLLEKLDEGWDVVYGIPPKLPHGIVRNFLSRATKRAMAIATDSRTIREIDAFRALRTNVRSAFAHFATPLPMFDVLLSWGTTRFSSLPVRHDPRHSGKSGYTFRKLANQALLLLTGFSTAPLRFASLLGFFMTLMGAGILSYVMGRYFLEGSVPGFPFIASLVALFGGAQLFGLGILGEYLAHVFNRTMDRPVYLVRETREKLQS